MRLSFKKVYVEPILEGRKTQTVRRYFHGNPGDIVEATCVWGDPPFAQLRVTAVERIPTDVLDDDDAKLDGFDNVLELRKAIHDHYGDVRAVARVRFEVVAGE